MWVPHGRETSSVTVQIRQGRNFEEDEIEGAEEGPPLTTRGPETTTGGGGRATGKSHSVSQEKSRLQEWRSTVVGRGTTVDGSSRHLKV